ncbi:MAG: DMT family transporter, partial [Hyphomonadaceae bacterium]
MTPAARAHAGAIAADGAGALLLGVGPILVRLSEVGPQATAAWRFIFALPVLALIALSTRRNRTPPNPQTLGVLAIAGVAFGLDIALWHASLFFTTVTNATLFSNMTPVLAAAAGWIFFRERVGWGFAAGAGASILGAAALAYSRAQGGRGDFSGDGLALFAAVWYAVYLVLMRGARRETPAAQAMFWTTSAALGVALTSSLLFGDVMLPQTLKGWAVLAGLGLIVQVGGQGLIAVGLGRLPIALSTVLLWLQPLAAAALAWFGFGEGLAPL